MSKEIQETRTRLDPRQMVFLSYYLDPKSKTFGNAKQSAIRANYSEQYADVILSKLPDWMREKIGNSGMLLKAEKNLAELLELPSQTQAMGAFGPIYEKIKVKGQKKPGKKAVMTHNIGLLKIKSDVSQFVAERIGRAVYGPKVADNVNNLNVVIFANDQRNKIAKRIIGGGSVSDIPSQE